MSVVVGEGVIQPTNLTSEDLRYIRKVSIRALIMFFLAEFIGFGFGVPVATVTAMGYGNIPGEVVVGVYLIPITVTTFVIVVFVALPTNIYLTRGLIGVIRTPSIQNLKSFVFSVPRIPIYASINLFVRITVGGVIVNVWGYIAQQGMVALESLIATTVSPIFGAWTASVVYFFSLQNILGNYNLKIMDYVNLERRSELLRFKLVSLRVIFPSAIVVTLVLSLFLIISGDVLNAGIWGILLILLSSALVIFLVLVVSYMTTRNTLVSIINILSKWEVQRRRLLTYGFYDVEEVIMRVRELNIVLLSAESALKSMLNDIKGFPEDVLSSSRGLLMALPAFRSRAEIKHFQFPNYQEIGDLLSQARSSLSSIVSSIRRFYENASMLVDSVERIGENVKGIEIVRGNLRESFTRISESVSLLSRFLSELEEVTSYMINIAKNAILKSARDIEKCSKEMEMIFINFQLEMAKVGYPDEFKFISLQLSKVLEDVLELARIIRSRAGEFENTVRKLYDEIRKVLVSCDSEFLLLSGQWERVEKVLGIPEEVHNNLKAVDVSEVKMREEVHLLEKRVALIGLEVSKISTNERTIKNLASTIQGRFYELQKIAESNVEKMKLFKRILSRE